MEINNFEKYLEKNSIIISKHKYRKRYIKAIVVFDSVKELSVNKGVNIFFEKDWKGYEE